MFFEWIRFLFWHIFSFKVWYCLKNRDATLLSHWDLIWPFSRRRNGRVNRITQPWFVLIRARTRTRIIGLYRAANTTSISAAITMMTLTTSHFTIPWRPGSITRCMILTQIREMRLIDGWPIGEITRDSRRWFMTGPQTTCPCTMVPK